MYIFLKKMKRYNKMYEISSNLGKFDQITPTDIIKRIIDRKDDF